MAGASISIYEFDSVVNTFIKMHAWTLLTDKMHNILREDNERDKSHNDQL